MAVTVQKLPAQAASQPETAVIRRTPANPDQALPSALRRGGPQYCRQTVSIEIERMKLARRQHCQPNDRRRFNDGSFAFRFPPPACFAWPMCRVHSFDGLDFCFEQPAD